MDRVWLNEYPGSVPYHLFLNPDETLVSLYEESCRKHAHKPAFTCQGVTLNYAETHRASTRFATYLQQELKLKPGDRVAIMLPNILQYPVALFGILQAGCVVVNLNPLDKARSLEYELTSSEAKAIVVSENFVSELRLIVDQTKLEKIIITSVGALYSPLKRWIVNFVVRHIKKMVPAWHHPKSIRFRRALHLGHHHTLYPMDIKSTDLAFLQYTGGTTGVAKGVELTHANMVANAHQCGTWISKYLVHKREAVITALPLYHVFSLMANCLVFVLIGGENVLIPNPRDIKGFIKTLRHTYFTGITGVNTLFNALLHNPNFKKCNFKHLTITLGGGMAVQKVVADQWYHVTGSVLCQGYGLTESSPVVTIGRFDRPYNGSIGLPVPLTDISIQDAEGHMLPVGEQGELCVKGPQVMRGYWRDSEATQKVLTKEGWLRTGDIAYIDAKGYTYIVDRLKDIVIVSGFKVCSIEVEEVISQLAGIKEVAIIGVPDPDHGEVVKAYVSLVPKAQLTEKDIIDYCRQKLLAYKVPKHVEIRDDLPKSNVGKILKKTLREALVQKS